MSVMFSGDALQCCNLGLRVNRSERNATVFRKRINRIGHFQAKSFVDLTTCRSCRVATSKLRIFFKASRNLAPFLLAPQRHNDLLVATHKNDAPILNRLKFDLIILRARFQAELLPFLYGFAVDNRKVSTLVERDRS